jgi:hypothetical protein
MFYTRRHVPPPRTNFEKLQDLLWQLKGVRLDVSTSGALAASLDACVVSFSIFIALDDVHWLNGGIRNLTSRHSTHWFA